MLKQNVWFRLLLFALLLFPASAFAAPRLVIAPAGTDGSSFVLSGEQMDGVAGLEIRIGYDATKIGNPRVTLGGLVGGMMSAVNPSNPIRMALVGTRPLSGSGIIATINFDRTGAAPGAIVSLTGSALSAPQGGKAASPIAMAAASITNPTATASGSGSETGGDNSSGSGSTATATTTTEGAGSAATTSRPYTGGSLSMPDQEGQPKERQGEASKTAQAENSEQQMERGESVPVPEEERTPAEKKEPAKPAVTPPVAIPSVLERFRQFQGEKTVEALTALFKQETGGRMSQLPPIAVSDGKKTVSLAINMATGDRAPNFAFSQAKYVSLHRTPDGWEVEVRPEQGVVRAAVTMLYEGQVQEFPLTVTPKVDLTPGKTRPVTEEDFKQFLKERGTPAAPKFDLNKDGRRDFIDDYIFTANYLLQMEEQESKKKGAKKP